MSLQFCKALYELPVSEQVQQFIDSILDDIKVNANKAHNHMCSRMSIYQYSGQEKAKNKVIERAKQFAREHLDEDLVNRLKEQVLLIDSLFDEEIYYVDCNDLLCGETPGFIGTYDVTEEYQTFCIETDPEQAMKIMVFWRFLYDRVTLELIKGVRTRIYESMCDDDFLEDDYTFAITRWQHHVLQ